MKYLPLIIAAIMLVPSVGIGGIFFTGNQDMNGMQDMYINAHGGDTYYFPVGTKIFVNSSGGAEEISNLSWLGESQPYKFVKPSYYIGVGMHDGERKIILNVYSGNVSVRVRYASSTSIADEYELLIITPEKFKKSMEKLASFKESHGMKTLIMTTDEIYSGYNGRDDAEKIKYAIKYAIENYGVKYVLLAGSIYKVPMRYTPYYSERYWKCYTSWMPTDLYYADIYRYDNGSVVFSSWDTNNNGIFGEKNWGCEGKGEDVIDLYPDVYVGRLAFNTSYDAKKVVEKIIKYESHAYGSRWFKRMILVGGDTFPGNNLIEGEFMNDYVANMMHGFDFVKIQASQGNLKAWVVEKELEKGAGFLYYSGHGFPYGWATHLPYNDNWTGLYVTPYILGLSNSYKLPVIFFDACLTAKPDFNSSDLREDGVNIPFNASYPSFAWYFVAHPYGGGIASIGATRVAFTGVYENGPEWGASMLAYQFFKAYMDSNTKILGEIFATAQEGYIADAGLDSWTLKEFILYGDPSLVIGGYE